MVNISGCVKFYKAFLVFFEGVALDRLVAELRNLAKKFPAENYEWKFPKNCPLLIPGQHDSNYKKNVFLKENFGKIISVDQSFDSHYWVIQDWGGIRSFKRSEENNVLIKNFLNDLDTGVLGKATFSRISSLSKIASFINPYKYSIYDSRVIYALNWLIFNYSTGIDLFPQPIGRSVELSKYDLQTIFRLSKRHFNYLTYKVSFHRYCDLLRKIAPEVFENNKRPYQLEMLLFMIADKKIIDDISSSVSLVIKNNEFLAF